MSAWTPPQTWTAVVVTVPDMNREIRDNFNALHPNLVTTTLNYSVALTDGHAVVVLVDATAGARTISLYTAVSNTGAVITVKKIDASINVVTIDPNAAETVDGQTTLTVRQQFDSMTLVSDGAKWVVVAERRAPVMRTITGTDTATIYDDLVEALSGTFTFTLHAASLKRRSASVTVVNNGTGTMTIAAAGGETIVGLAALDLRQYESAVLTPNAAGTAWIVS
jgi:hypothetical protein